MAVVATGQRTRASAHSAAPPNIAGTHAKLRPELRSQRNRLESQKPPAKYEGTLLGFYPVVRIRYGTVSTFLR